MDGIEVFVTFFAIVKSCLILRVYCTKVECFAELERMPKVICVVKGVLPPGSEFLLRKDL